MELDLYLKLEKCKFATKKIKYLDMIVQPRCLAMDPIKLDGITSWPTPTKPKDICSFLGFVNFYWHFIPDYSNIAHLLSKRTLPGLGIPPAKMPLTT